jgi:hypothetical protein
MLGLVAPAKGFWPVIDDEIIESVRRSLEGVDAQAPATTEQAIETGLKIGYPITQLLKRLYLEVANGGFSPRNLVMGTAAGQSVVGNENINNFLCGNGPVPDHPLSGLVKIVDWACAVSSLVDFTDPGGPMWAIDNGAHFREGMNFSRVD